MPKRNSVISLIPLELWLSKIQLGLGYINLKIFLKISLFSEFLIFGSSLFHSFIVEGKYECLKNSCVLN